MKNLKAKKWCGQLGGLFSVLLIGATSVQAESSMAQHFVCGHSGEVREVAVKFAEGNQLPCAVTYTKKGEEKTLWRARHESNFCGVRAQELIAKLEGRGWRCTLSEHDGVAAKTGAAMTDSKSSVAPADEMKEASVAKPTATMPTKQPVSTEVDGDAGAQATVDAAVKKTSALPATAKVKNDS